MLKRTGRDRPSLLPDCLRLGAVTFLFRSVLLHVEAGLWARSQLSAQVAARKGRQPFDPPR